MCVCIYISICMYILHVQLFFASAKTTIACPTLQAIVVFADDTKKLDVCNSWFRWPTSDPPNDPPTISDKLKWSEIWLILLLGQNH